jgi:hypothetical protein
LTVRFYDAALATWRQVWIGVPRGEAIEFTARRDGPRIPHRRRYQRDASSALELRAGYGDGILLEGRTSTDRGGTWHLEETIHGELRPRREPAGRAPSRR